MAKKVEDTKTISVKALVYLKYNKNCYKTGDEFQVNEDDLKEMEERELIRPGKEILNDALPDVSEPGADANTPKEGE